jgi:hypothetical protein
MGICLLARFRNRRFCGWYDEKHFGNRYNSGLSRVAATGHSLLFVPIFDMAVPSAESRIEFSPGQSDEGAAPRVMECPVCAVRVPILMGPGMTGSDGTVRNVEIRLQYIFVNTLLLYMSK